MSLIHEIKEQDHMRTRFKRAGLLALYALLILVALFLFARRWSAFALLVPPLAAVIVVIFAMRIARVLRFRRGERRQTDRRHTDRRDHEEGGEGTDSLPEPRSPASRRTG